MSGIFDRRSFLLSSAAAPFLMGARPRPVAGAPRQEATQEASQEAKRGRFPHQDPALVKEVVAMSHINLDRVRELVDARPALARATWDWGFGDWETALGAASHTGQREIAEYLIAQGARADIFSAAMLGQVDTVRAFVRASPGIEATPGPHGITLLAHARAGGAAAADVLAYLEELGTADTTWASEPLSEEGRRPFMGVYAYGPGDSDRMEISENRGMLRLVPEGDTARVLFYLGDGEFFPTGVPWVRIRFEMRDGVATALTVVDADTTLRAERVQ